MPSPDELLSKEDKVKIKRCLYGLQRTGLPPITTHNVVDDYSDPVLSGIRRCHLFNTVNDRVKVSVSTTFAFISYSSCSSVQSLFGVPNDNM